VHGGRRGAVPARRGRRHAVLRLIARDNDWLIVFPNW
jgi:hypothetical protein